MGQSLSADHYQQDLNHKIITLKSNINISYIQQYYNFKCRAERRYLQLV